MNIVQKPSPDSNSRNGFEKSSVQFSQKTIQFGVWSLMEAIASNFMMSLPHAGHGPTPSVASETISPSLRFANLVKAQANSSSADRIAVDFAKCSTARACKSSIRDRAFGSKSARTTDGATDIRCEHLSSPWRYPDALKMCWL